MARFPPAPGANGDPPRPPTAVSKRRMPRASAAWALVSAVPRVSWRCRPTAAPTTVDHGGDAARTGGAGGVGEGDPIDARRPDLGYDIRHRPDRDIVEGRAEAARHHGVDDHRRRARRPDAGELVQRLGHGHPDVLGAVPLAGRDRHRELPDATGQGQLGAAHVGDQGPPARVARIVEGPDDVGRSRHRRHGLRRDERGHLHLGESGRRQRLHERQPLRGRARPLTLQPVAWPTVAEHYSVHVANHLNAD